MDLNNSASSGGPDFPDDVDRIIRAAVYRRLPGPRLFEERRDVCQQARIEWLAAVSPEMTGDHRRALAHTIAERRAMDAGDKLRRRGWEQPCDEVAALADPDSTDCDPAEEMESASRTLLVLKAYLWGAKRVHQTAETRRAKGLQFSPHDLLARELTRRWLRGLLDGTPPCVSDIGDELGIEDRRRSSEVFGRVKKEARRYLDDHGFDHSDWPE